MPSVFLYGGCGSPEEHMAFWLEVIACWHHGGFDGRCAKDGFVQADQMLRDNITPPNACAMVLQEANITYSDALQRAASLSLLRSLTAEALSALPPHPAWMSAIQNERDKCNVVLEIVEHMVTQSQ
eukprot:2423292-Amphidinium_carterae.3